MNKILLSILLITLSLAAPACNLPSSQGQTVSPEAVYTQAAQTIAAQLTDIAGQANATSTPPVSSPFSTGVATTNLSTATGTVTPTGTATLTTTPMLTQTLALTAAPSDPKSGLGEPDWQDDFTNEANWSLYEDDYVRFLIKDGKLLMQAKSGQSRDSWILTWPKPVDYYLEASFRPQTCANFDRYGTVIRAAGGEGYLFGITCDGTYSLRKWDGDQFVTLKDWTPSPYILAGPGQTNRLGIKVEGENYSMYANGYYLDQVNDDSFEKGGFGVYVGSKGEEDFEAEVDEIAYWELP